MSANAEHSKIITEAAKETLLPLGMFQKGRSRTWIEDRSWWIVLIEFQPSSWSKGSYLNVAAMWLWHEKDYFSFDTASQDSSSRVAPFIRYVDEKQFTPEALRLASSARTEALKLHARFPSIHAAASYLPGQARRNESPWTKLSAAIALGYVGKTLRSRWLFKSMQRWKPVHDWEYELQQRARGFAELLDRPAEFQRYVREAIHRTRSLLKLPHRANLKLDG